MTKYSYEYYVNRKDLTDLAESSWDGLVQAGYNPADVWHAFAENPHLLMMEDKEQVINELLGWLGRNAGRAVDAAKAGWNAVSNYGAGRRADLAQAALQRAQGMSPEDQAKMGITPEKLADLQARYTQNQNTRGFGGAGRAMQQGWNQARNQRADLSMQKQFGVGPYAPFNPAAASPSPAASPAAPGTPSGPGTPPVPPGSGGTPPGTPPVPPGSGGPGGAPGSGGPGTPSGGAGGTPAPKKARPPRAPKPAPTPPAAPTDGSGTYLYGAVSSDIEKLLNTPGLLGAKHPLRAQLQDILSKMKTVPTPAAPAGGGGAP